MIKDEINKNLKNKIKIVHISDLHIKRDKKIYKDLIGNINNIKPDLLLITGDSIENNKNLPLLDKLLSKINEPIKKYAILGNHEYRGNVNVNDLKKIFEKNGVKLLINNGEEITIKGTKINLWGADDYHPDFEKFKYKENLINIIMVHRPVYFDEICKIYHDKDIIVSSGHTHGGQITFFGKPLLLPDGCGNYLKGKYINNNLILYVSKGIGTTGLDLRINADPDLIFITLK